jgi:hypothetical protein
MSMLIDPVVSTYCDHACAIARDRFGRTRVERGSAGYGCGVSDPCELIGASRDAEPPDARFYAVGFRICLSRSCNVNAD